MTVFTSPKIMGILNVTPDSFSDGGHFFSRAAALTHARQLVAEGADLIDIGGESTRPGALPVSIQEELDRVIPLVEQLHAELPILISVDTHKPQVMQAAIAAGAQMINDVTALRSPNSLAIVAAATEVYICLMHMQNEPRTMQEHPTYDDVVCEISDFLRARIQACLAAGIASSRIIIDPGFGFGKTLLHNLQLMNQLQELTTLGYPVLVGVSRKSMLGKILNKPPLERLSGGLALAALALNKGAKIIRTHDVAPTVEVLKVVQAVLTESWCED